MGFPGSVHSFRLQRGILFPLIVHDIDTLTYLKQGCVCVRVRMKRMYNQVQPFLSFLWHYLRKRMGVGDSKCTHIMMSHLSQEARGRRVK